MPTSTNHNLYEWANRAIARGRRLPALFIVTAMACAPSAQDDDGLERLAQQAAPGVDDPRAPEASPAPSAESLIGRYVTRLQSFWVSPTGVRAVHELGLAEFAKVGDEIVLRTRVCTQRTFQGDYRLELFAPDLLSEITRKVKVDGSRWQTDAEPIAVGYARGEVPACVGRGGQAISKNPTQAWIIEPSCQCPSDPAAIPTLADCRVEDPDYDRGPGVTYVLSGPDGILRAEHYAGLVRSHAVRGVIDPRGAHRAEWKLDEGHYRLSCWPGTCGASEGTEAPCTSDVNRLEFIPLASIPAVTEWTCTAAREQEPILFREPPLAAPASCSQDTLTDPRR